MRPSIPHIPNISPLVCESGQMAIELAVCMPVILAIMIVVVDIGVFLGDCARFDRSVPQIVQVYASSPESESYAESAVISSIKGELESVMGSDHSLQIEVSSKGALTGSSKDSSGILSFVPEPQTYTCTLIYSPWPFVNGAFGVIPVEMRHSFSYCIDPYRPGALI